MSRTPDTNTWRGATWILLGLGFAVRLYDAATNYLNPDEAMHLQVALLPSLAEVLAHHQDFSHPPLLLLTLWTWLKLGTSEVVARSWLAICTMGAAALGHAWVRRRWGEEAALFALAFWAVSPLAIAVGSEIRQAGVMLLFAAAALIALEHSIDRRQRRWVAAYTLCLIGAIGSHYGAAWILVGLGLYAPLRWHEAGLLRHLGVTWAVGQFVTVALAAWSFWSNWLALEITKSGDYIASFKYAGGEASLVDFVRHATVGAFTQLAGQPKVGLALLALVALGFVRTLTADRTRRADAVWLGVPMLLAVSGGIWAVMPWGNTRHIAFLLPMVGTAFGIGLAGILPRHRLVTLAGLCGCVLVFYCGAETLPDRIPRPPQDMHAMLRYIERQVAPTELVLIDGGTYPVLGYYLRHERRGRWSISPPKQSPPLAGKPTYAMLNVWQFARDSWWEKAMQALPQLHVRPGEHVWLVSVGWWTPQELHKSVPEGQLLRHLSFGALRLLEFVYRPMPPGPAKSDVPQRRRQG